MIDLSDRIAPWWWFSGDPGHQLMFSVVAVVVNGGLLIALIRLRDRNRFVQGFAVVAIALQLMVGASAAATLAAGSSRPQGDVTALIERDTGVTRLQCQATGFAGGRVRGRLLADAPRFDCEFESGGVIHMGTLTVADGYATLRDEANHVMTRKDTE